MWPFYSSFYSGGQSICVINKPYNSIWTTYGSNWAQFSEARLNRNRAPNGTCGSMVIAASSLHFRSPDGTDQIAPKRSAGRRKRQPQERQHNADAGTAAGGGNDYSRQAG